jgi:hypothetical protein
MLTVPAADLTDLVAACREHFAQASDARDRLDPSLRRPASRSRQLTHAPSASARLLGASTERRQKCDVLSSVRLHYWR